MAFSLDDMKLRFSPLDGKMTHRSEVDGCMWSWVCRDVKGVIGDGVRLVFASGISEESAKEFVTAIVERFNADAGLRERISELEREVAELENRR